MRLVSITIRDAHWHPIPGASVTTPTAKTTSDANGRVMIVMHPGDTVAVEAKGYRRTTSVVSESIADIILLPDKLKILGVPLPMSRKAWLAIPLAVGLGAAFLAGLHEFEAIRRAKRRNQRRTGEMAVGDKELGQWQQEMADDLAALYVHMALLASPDTEKAMEAATGDLKEPPGYRFSMDRLRTWAHEIAEGKTVNLIGRAEMYADSGHGVYEKVAAETLPDDPDFRWEERSILSPAEHCGQCLKMARKGWQPRGSLIPIGRRTCRQNCRCSMQYRRVHIASSLAVA